ncbi:NAD(P)/FAD-dependent oxidoreductase [Ancylobacter vacuolatus]|uniref:D-amino-acid dehydrogenase n=1 Tax=Ancylobacter vacuolatus TaxID=223389 RepID=A0ABU0DKT8_9HYPH|nr:FAD-binding oxidoreductase [Ancylobacter vacuolatus]MDQ0349052.1 D-amino-acid dehydrogenase [Ancylobacter vacuolatus]
MPAPGEQNIAVIGAGIVGISSALYLQRAGFAVTLIDRDEPGHGATFGNAAALAPHAFVPINSPSIPRRLLPLLFASGSPLSIDWGYAPRMLPWLLSFLSHCTPTEVTRIAQAMHALLSRNLDYALPLFRESGADRLMRGGGYLHLYESEAAYRASAGEVALYKRLADDVEEIDAAQIRRLEPNLAPVFVRALYFHSALHYLSTVDVCATLVKHFCAQGGRFLRDEVGTLEARADGRIRVAGTQESVYDQAVLAAGAQARRLFGGAVEKLPLETERGYHIMFGGQAGIISRTCSSATAGFAMTPMTAGLRCAGMVELAGLDKPPNPACHAYLDRTAKRFLPGITENPSSNWMGFRPSMPDALPVIGRSARTANIILAFGHQHVGMSSGCVTGAIVADIAAGRTPAIDITPFSPARF